MQSEIKEEIALRLQDKAYLFRAFWEFASVEFCEEIPTAQVEYFGDNVLLKINPEFWKMNSLSQDFLIAHECLHVILRHAKRFASRWGSYEHDKINIAADIVINELLLEIFKISRLDLDQNLSSGCFLETVFQNRKDILPNESTEYYFSILETPSFFDKAKDFFGLGNSGGKSFDSHVILENSTDSQDLAGQLIPAIDNELEKILSKNLGELNKAASIIKTAGTGAGGFFSYKNLRVSIKRKWETVLKNYLRRKFSYCYSEESRWDRPNVRYGNALNIELPQDHILQVYKKNKPEIFFFLDTSGSCWNLRDRFIKAAKSVNPEKFDIKLFSFDTIVKEVDLDSGKIYGGGGTSFRIIEQTIKTFERYPDSVWIITDGYGDNVKPEFPKRWHWFLSENYTYYIPKESNIYMLKDYE